jgi:hypothetical protein
MIEQNKHWLLRKDNIRKLWIIFIAILAITVIAGLFVHQHQSFGIEDSFGFFAWYGFVSCIGMIVFAKLLGLFLKRPEDYYEKDLNKGEVDND